MSLYIVEINGSQFVNLKELENKLPDQHQWLLTKIMQEIVEKQSFQSAKQEDIENILLKKQEEINILKKECESQHAEKISEIEEMENELESELREIQRQKLNLTKEKEKFTQEKIAFYTDKLAKISK